MKEYKAGALARTGRRKPPTRTNFRVEQRLPALPQDWCRLSTVRCAASHVWRGGGVVYSRVDPCGQPGVGLRCYTNVCPKLSFEPATCEKTAGGTTSPCSRVPLWAACIKDQIFSDLSGISIDLIPNGARASSTALTMAGGAAIQPASPTPFAPSGLIGEGVSTEAVTKSGIWSAIGKV